ncbi:MAG: ARPP-1 family domain-containing protein [Flavitalea sp.]
MGQLTYETVFVDYDSAWTYKNMKLIPVRVKGIGQPPTEVLTLKKAMERGLVTLSERGSASTENVHWVRINNRSDKPIFISSGEIILGGRQDRMLSKDTIMIPNGKDQYIPAMCVEENRWSDKEKKFTYHGYSNSRLRRVMNQSGNQVLIWKEVYAQLDSSKIKNPTLAYGALRNDKNNATIHLDYLNYFNTKIDSTVIGVICVAGNKILGTDIFAAPNLFKDAASSILAGYIEDAVVQKSDLVVTTEMIQDFIDPVLMDESSQKIYCNKNGKLFRYRGKVFHLTAYPEK